MKKFLIVLMSIICFVSIGIDAWYLYVMKYAPEKIVSQTYEVGEQRVLKEDGSTDSKAFIELNVFDNVFEMKFNYMLDETQTQFASQGVQYVSNSSTLDFSGKYSTNPYYENLYSSRVEKSGIANRDYHNYYNIVLTNKQYNNLNVYNYQSADDYETCLGSTNKIDDETMFKIQIGDDLYGMKFKYVKLRNEFKIGQDLNVSYDMPHLWQVIYNYEYNDYYKACDISYFSELVYSACRSVPAGTSKNLVFEFGDLFDYYKYNEETKQYSKNTVETDEYSKIVADVKSYYCVKVTKHEGVLESSSQSIFNCYAGKMNYNTQESFDDYFIGRGIVKLDYLDFEFLETDITGEYELALSSSFRAWYYDYRNKIALDITIDKDYLDTLHIKYKGINKASLDGFRIYRLTEIENSVASEVEYA